MFPILSVSPWGKKGKKCLSFLVFFFCIQNWFSNSSLVTIPQYAYGQSSRFFMINECHWTNTIYKKQLIATYQVFPTKLTYLALQRQGQLSGFRALPLFSDDLPVERGLAQLKISLENLENGIRNTHFVSRLQHFGKRDRYEKHINTQVPRSSSASPATRWSPHSVSATVSPSPRGADPC